MVTLPRCWPSCDTWRAVWKSWKKAPRSPLAARLHTRAVVRRRRRPLSWVRDAVRAVASLPSGPAPSPGSASFKDMLRSSSLAGGPRRPGRDAPEDGGESDGEADVHRASHAPRRDQLSILRADERLAPDIMKRLYRSHSSALDFVRSREWTNARSSHEARRVAQAIDAFVSEGVHLEFEGMEILVRTMAGLHTSDQNGNAGLLEEMEWAPPDELLPADVFRTLVKDSQRKDKIRAAAKKPAPAATPKNPKKGGGGAGK